MELGEALKNFGVWFKFKLKPMDFGPQMWPLDKVVPEGLLSSNQVVYFDRSYLVVCCIVKLAELIDPIRFYDLIPFDNLICTFFIFG
jgi:hypothetical protein